MWLSIYTDLVFLITMAACFMAAIYVATAVAVNAVVFVVGIL